MNNEIILYQSDDLPERIEVRIEEETVWLNQGQLSSLFRRGQSVISRLIRNVFKEGELEEKSNMQKVHIPNSDKPVVFCNLDVIISVGYLVKSKQSTQFRIWTTHVLRDYLLKGYALNQRMNRVKNNEDCDEKMLRLCLRNAKIFFEKLIVSTIRQSGHKSRMSDQATQQKILTTKAA